MNEENVITMYKDFVDYTMNQHTQIIRANLIFDRHLFQLLTNQSSNRIRRPIPNTTPISTQARTNRNNRLFSVVLPNPLNNSIASPQNRLSIDFIQNNTTTNVYSNLTNRVNNTCPITRNEFSENSIATQINGCGHCFDTTAINHWFLRGNSTCPTCRYDLLANESNETNETNETNTPNTTNINSTINTSNASDPNIIEAEITSILFNPIHNSTHTNANMNINDITRNLFNIATQIDSSLSNNIGINTHVTSFS